jgi:hypothetical protein
VFLPPDGLAGVENAGLGSLVVGGGFKGNSSQQQGQRCGGGRGGAAFAVTSSGLGRLLVLGLDSPSVDVRSSGWVGPPPPPRRADEQGAAFQTASGLWACCGWWSRHVVVTACLLVRGAVEPDDFPALLPCSCRGQQAC